MRARLLSLFGLTLGLACGQAGDDMSLGTLEQPIMNGAPSDESDDQTLYIWAKPPGADHTTCTGTLIAPNLVATALHCVTFSQSGTFTCAPDGTVTPLNPGDGAIGGLVPASSVEIYLGAQVGRTPAAVGARLFGTGSSQICRNDMAFIVLDRSLDAPVSKVRLSGNVRLGDTVHIVGYGATEVHGSSGRFARSGVRIVDVGPVSDGEPTRTAAPRTFVLSEGPCHGDSGGPAFAEETGALLGVYSLSAGESCTGVGIRNVYTSLLPFSELALAAFDAAGAEPLLEELEPEPVAPPIVAEQGCSLAASPGKALPSTLALLVALLLGGLRRSYRGRRGH